MRWCTDHEPVEPASRHCGCRPSLHGSRFHTASSWREEGNETMRGVCSKLPWRPARGPRQRTSSSRASGFSKAAGTGPPRSRRVRVRSTRATPTRGGCWRPADLSREMPPLRLPHGIGPENRASTSCRCLASCAPGIAASKIGRGSHQARCSRRLPWRAPNAGSRNFRRSPLHESAIDRNRADPPT